MRNTAAIILLGCVSLTAYGQDTHFSQFFFSPQWLSPAEIGRMDAQYRGVANQRTQWRQVSQPYSTFAISIDGRPDFLPENVSAGIAILNDRAGDSRFNTFTLLLGGAYRYQLGESRKHQLHGGVQVGLTQVSIDPDALSFDNQFNGVAYDPNLPTGENFARNSRWNFNLNLGLNYSYQLARDKSVNVGYALHNLTSPDRSFFNDVGVVQPTRHAFFATGTWNVKPDIDLLPAMRYMRQATFSEFVMGSAVRYTLLNERNLYRAVFAGYFGRLGDSGIALLGIEIDDWRVGISYDINVSNLQVASRNRGGFEFSVQYLMNREPRNPGFQHKYCPTFL